MAVMENLRDAMRPSESFRADERDEKVDADSQRDGETEDGFQHNALPHSRSAAAAYSANTAKEPMPMARKIRSSMFLSRIWIEHGPRLGQIKDRWELCGGPIRRA
jgi:hypothetical protein